MSPPERHPPSTVFEALARRRLIIVSGKGGVGRTTVAALLGAALARRGRKVLVATTGHDDRLAWLMGARVLEDRPVEVSPGLSVQHLDPRVCVREYGALVLRSERLSGAVFDNRVVRRLLRAIPGLDDFAVLGKVWHAAVRARDFDVIIFDGPATGHLRLGLGVPRTIIGAVPGGPLVKEAQLIQASLENESEVAAVLVGLPESWPLTELGELGAALREDIGLSIAAVVINGLSPSDLPELGEPPHADQALADAVAVVDRVTNRGRTQAAQVDAWLASTAAGRCAPQSLLEVEWCGGGVEDRAALDAMVSRMEAI